MFSVFGNKFNTMRRGAVGARQKISNLGKGISRGTTNVLDKYGVTTGRSKNYTERTVEEKKEQRKEYNKRNEQMYKAKLEELDLERKQLIEKIQKRLRNGLYTLGELEILKQPTLLEELINVKNSGTGSNRVEKITKKLTNILQPFKRNFSNTKNTQTSKKQKLAYLLMKARKAGVQNVHLTSINNTYKTHLSNGQKNERTNNQKRNNAQQISLASKALNRFRSSTSSVPAPTRNGQINKNGRKNPQSPTLSRSESAPIIPSNRTR